MIEHSSKKYYALMIVSMLVTATTATSLPAYSAPTTGIMIPLYTYPGSTWDQVIATKNAHPSVPIIAKINPSNGPGFSYDANFDSGITELQSAGIIVIGYVYTQWGERSSSAVIADVDRYKNWYPQLDGIFFDEMSASSGDESHYLNLSNYAKSVGFSYTVGNPGTDIAQSYVGTMDNIIIYETGGLPSLDRLGGWHTSYDKSNFSYLAFGVGSLDTNFVDTSSNYVSWLYITNDNFPNPWDSVPPYFMDLAAALDDGTTSPPPTPNPDQATLSVQSADLAGSAITGMWTEIHSGGTLLTTGFTPFSYTANTNTEYQVCVDSFENTVFDHWEDESTNSCRTITPTQDVTMTASYKTSVDIVVNSVNLAGSPITGMWTVISNDGTQVKTGYTPLTHTGVANTQYQVCVSDYQQQIFDHWSDGSTNSCKTITPIQSTTMTAYYKTPVTINVRSVGLDGSTFTGMWTEISSGGTTVKTGYTTLSFTGSSGVNYTVCVANYQNNVFDHWSDGSTQSCKTFKPTQSQTLTAFYMR